MCCKFSNLRDSSYKVCLDGIEIGASRKFRYFGLLVHEGYYSEDVNCRIKVGWLE